ncbi:MAG TPA: hypothetical protein H9776_07435, partial [Candidatus Mediterraneibacter intestinipullorum]|nr:hypothetical protein [Candidatus Mediterraneibacter intestinipullorum]
MNDALYELIVARRPKPYDLPVRILVILAVVAIAVLGMPFLGFFSFTIALLVAVLAYYFIFPRLNVEYEYILLNHDIQIDVIYNRSKRKNLQNFDIQTAEIIAPKGSPRLNSFKPDKVFDFSSGNPSARVYVIMIALDKNNACVY